MKANKQFKVAVQTAIREMATENPGAELDKDAITARAKALLTVTDFAAVLDLALDAAYEGVHTEFTKFDDQQLGLPFMPEPDRFLVIGSKLIVQWQHAKLLHITASRNLRYENAERAFAKARAFDAMTEPLVPHLARGLDWAEAFEAWRRDYSDDVSAEGAR